jgi:hypothetical protein
MLNGLKFMAPVKKLIYLERKWINVLNCFPSFFKVLYGIDYNLRGT